MNKTDTGEVCETNTMEMNISTARHILYVCPNCKETFEHPCVGSTSYGAAFEYCPHCEIHLQAAFYEVAE